MTDSVSPSLFAPHAEYCRKARHIRRVFARQPARRMRALCALAHDQEAKRADVSPPPIATLPTGAAGTFAGLVRERMDGPVLRYSHRTRLIRDAERRGIGRFEANLIIAAVQHQRRESRGAVAPPASRAAWIPFVVGFCATQSAAAAGVWWLLT